MESRSHHLSNCKRHPQPPGRRWEALEDAPADPRGVIAWSLSPPPGDAPSSPGGQRRPFSRNKTGKPAPWGTEPEVPPSDG